VLRILCNSFFLGLLRGCDGSTRIFCTNADTEEETIQYPADVGLAAKRGVTSLADLPTCTEHSKEARGTMVSAGRRRGEGRKESNDSSSEHLGRVKPILRWASLVREVVRTIPNLRPILSETQPKMSMPTKVPAKATLVSVLL
jgi:hypothetical protein